MNHKDVEEKLAHYAILLVCDCQWSIHQRCKGSRVFSAASVPNAFQQKWRQMVAYHQSRLFLRRQENLSAGFRWNLAWGHSADAWYTPSEHTCIFFPFHHTPPRPRLGLLCPSPATTQRWYKRGSLAICILLPLLFQTAVLNFTSYKPKIPTTLSTKVVLPFPEGLGEGGTYIMRFPERREKSVCCWPPEP